MKYAIEAFSSEDEASNCGWSYGSSVETASLTKDPSLASSFSNDTLEDCYSVSPEQIRHLRMRRGGFCGSLSAPEEISLLGEELLIERYNLLDDDGVLQSHSRQGKKTGKYQLITLLWIVLLLGFWSILESLRRSEKWPMPSRRLVVKIGKRSAKVAHKETGLTVLLSGSRINLLHQSLETFENCDKVRQIQINWTSSDDSFPVNLLSHDTNKVVALSPSSDFETDAVMLLEESVQLTCEDLERAFHQWKLDPSRIVGFLPDNDQVFSQVSDQAVLVHRYYVSKMPQRMNDDPCQHFSLSVFITAISGKSPVVLISDLIHNRRFNVASKCLDVLSVAAGKLPMPPSPTRYIGLHA